MLVTEAMLPGLRVSLEVLKVSREPQSPVLHLYLASSSGSRDQDTAVLRKIVSLVSFCSVNDTHHSCFTHGTLAITYIHHH